MTDHPPHLDRRRFLVAGLGAVLAACAGQTGGSTSSSTPTPTGSPSATPSSTPSPAAPSPSPTATAAAAATPDLPTGIVPVRVRIPSIGVDAPCIELQLKADEVEVPEDFDDTGWWVQTRRPGEIGPAVIGGHVDSRSGPAVFYRIGELQPGDEIVVEDEAGETRTFSVDREPLQVDKYERPQEVFGFTDPVPQLRLITCGGDFNPAIGHYTDNIVVFSSIVDA